MQPVNDDMDHLFRQAANDYPLNTQGGDFDKLQQRMQVSATDEVPLKKERKRRFGWLLLLLISLPFILQHNYKPTTTRNQQLATVNSNKSNTLPQNAPAKSIEIFSAGSDSDVSNQTVIDRKSDSSFTNKTTDLSPAQTTQKETPAPKPISSAQHTNKMVAHRSSGANTALVNRKRIAIGKQELDNEQKVAAKKNKRNFITRNKLGYSPTDSLIDNDMAVLRSGKRIVPENKDSGASTSGLPGGINDNITENKTADSISLTAQKKDSIASGIAKAAAAKDSATQDTTPQKKQPKNVDKPNIYFYAGVVAGPDYSVVKSTRTGSTGYNAGIVAGYRLGRHWGIETGLLWNHKSYYSDGQYVSTEKLMLLMHTEVLHINGYCDLFEIPLNVQYHFSSKRSGHLYITIGLSSYLMKQEEYYYLYRRYNMDYYGEKDYPNSTKNWFSVLQLSGGYQLKLSKNSSLRAEPYIKLPVSKIGIAQLPLSSTGLTIGYSRSF